MLSISIPTSAPITPSTRSVQAIHDHPCRTASVHGHNGAEA
jgi:hypothetical protein